ncbi:MAG: nucleoside hydrolase [Bacteroidetes bacterium]|nr:nucleoside hydrolase [Bacteroidota bacterium]
MKRKILIDTDPGHDDAIAIMLLMAQPETFEILGFTTVAGNQTVEKVTRNMLKIAELTGSPVPIAIGEKKPMKRVLETGGTAHGESGMDGPNLPEPILKPVDEPGVEFLHAKIIQSPEPVTILALGPLTNIAVLLSRYPEVKERISEISLMGGEISSGNITRAAEFNIYVDPEAAEIVFSSSIPITMSGLDVTEKAIILPTEWNKLRSGGRASQFTAELLDFYNIYSDKLGFSGSCLHDACAAAWLIHPELFTSRKLNIKIETMGVVTRGMTVADTRKVPRHPANINVLIDVNREQFVDLVLRNLAKLDVLINN